MKTSENKDARTHGEKYPEEILADEILDMPQDEKTKKLRLFDLSQCDEDIAMAYKKFGVLDYMAERPLILQLSRDIRSLVNIFCGIDSKIQISTADNSEKNSPESDDAS